MPIFFFCFFSVWAFSPSHIVTWDIYIGTFLYIYFYTLTDFTQMAPGTQQENGWWNRKVIDCFIYLPPVHWNCWSRFFSVLELNSLRKPPSHTPSQSLLLSLSLSLSSRGKVNPEIVLFSSQRWETHWWSWIFLHCSTLLWSTGKFQKRMVFECGQFLWTIPCCW